MLTLKKLLTSKGNKPYTTPVKVKVCGVGDTTKYTTDSGEQKQSTTLGIADKEDAIKAIVYDSAKLNTCQLGASIMLLNFIFKSDPSPVIVITNRTRVLKCETVGVPDEVQQRAALLANPPPAKTVPVKDVKLSPVKTMVSVQGRIVSEDMVRTVKVRGSDVLVKTVTVKDDTDSIKVSLWREQTSLGTVGEYLQFTDVVVNSYNDEVSVSTTAKSKISACEPPVSKLQGMVVAFETVEMGISLMVEKDGEYPSFEASKEFLANCLQCQTEEVEGVVEEKLPFKVDITVSNNNIETLEVIQ